MASKNIAINQTRKAKVQWWDNRDMHILCPWCKEIHRHGFNGNYSQHHRRVPHCDPVFDGKFRHFDYDIQFPLGVLSADSYEIDKDNLRFVAGGAHVPDDDDVIPEDEADHLRADFRRLIEKKRKWTEATETEIIENFPTKKIGLVVSQMVQGKIMYVREYLESSSEADIFLCGVESWERPQYNASDNESEEISTEDNTTETLGDTALHMAACESSSEMVQLLLSKGADPNAMNCDGRTALMEAALWGRLENVEILLECGADKSKTCIDSGKLRCAAYFAKPLKQNVKVRRRRAGGDERRSKPIYMEDTYARDKDREDIVFLLEDVVDELGPHQLDTCVYKRSPNDRTMLSLTTHYSLPNEWKTVAYMDRGGGLPEIAAMSGWSHAQSKNICVAGRDWTEAVLDLCKLVGFFPESNYRDRGVPGRFNACHAEKQLIAYFAHKHLFLELGIRKGSGVESTFSMLTLEELADQPYDEYKVKLANLREASPSNSLKEAKIVVSSPLCDDCKRFAAKVNRVLRLDLRLYHRCLESSCTVCLN
ncbi:hypothetical protein GL218_05895 [Daldinia childiae]|uniref:uncharacterized protein n=1 Tax=Daldinia childiae TaxID=326645 RepID=UPI001444A925|nr:uncharacterized protein GL218_05895 [Daldinia childiae]KAF3058583.1 hypothetical protein GL218_05895 [Daldinia childiae]